MSGDQNAGRITIYGLIIRSCFERAEQFGYLGTTLTNQNSIQIEVTEYLLSFGAFDLKVFTDYWMFPVQFWVDLSVFYSEEHSTYTCCLCQVHSVQKENKLPVQATVPLQCARAHVQSNCFIASPVQLPVRAQPYRRTAADAQRMNREQL